MAQGHVACDESSEPGGALVRSSDAIGGGRDGRRSDECIEGAVEVEFVSLRGRCESRASRSSRLRDLDVRPRRCRGSRGGVGWTSTSIAQRSAARRGRTGRVRSRVVRCGSLADETPDAGSDRAASATMTSGCDSAAPPGNRRSSCRRIVRAHGRRGDNQSMADVEHVAASVWPPSWSRLLDDRQKIVVGEPPSEIERSACARGDPDPVAAFDDVVVVDGGGPVRHHPLSDRRVARRRARCTWIRRSGGRRRKPHKRPAVGPAIVSSGWASADGDAQRVELGQRHARACDRSDAGSDESSPLLVEAFQLAARTAAVEQLVDRRRRRAGVANSRWMAGLRWGIDTSCDGRTRSEGVGRDQR